MTRVSEWWCLGVILLWCCMACGSKQSPEPPAGASVQPQAQTSASMLPAQVSPVADATTTPTVSAAAPAQFVSIRGERFVDPQGRQILFHGINIVCKDTARNYQSWQGAQEFDRLRQAGMNCVRLGLIWDGLEPEPGRYDEDYLKGVDQRIEWARQAGLYVFLDMHQDLYSVQFGDGAPAWATLTGGAQHVQPAGVWSDAYFISPGVQTALDNFWANAPGPDGVGIQERFALAWRHVARRYAQDPTVLGYDLFNEPNPGQLNPQVLMALVTRLMQIVKAEDPTSTATLPQMFAQWLDPAQRGGYLKHLDNMQTYGALLAAAEPFYQQFERTQLTAMLERVTRAIRQVDPHHIIFFEPNMSANMGVPSGLELLTGADGRPDPLQAYAPHAYDIVTDTPELALASTGRLALIFERHAQTRQRLGVPMLVGEWGAYGGAGEEILPLAQFTVAQFEALLCSETYWDYGQGVMEGAYACALDRPYPRRVAGRLLATKSHPAQGRFECTWEEDADAQGPTQIYLPGAYFSGLEGIELEGGGPALSVEPVAGSKGSVVLNVPAAGRAVRRSLKSTGPPSPQP